MSDTITYRIPLHLADEARSRIEKANRRLSKAGIEERFTWSETVVAVDNDGRTTGAVDIELSTPSISFSGWEFVAAVNVLETGTVLSTPPHVNADNLPRPEDHRCDHCDKIRSRKYSYLLRNEDGEVRQVGKSCLKLFLGVSPSGLWALQWDDLEELVYDIDSQIWDKSPDLYPVIEVVKIAMNLTDNGRNYISRDRSLYDGVDSTAANVLKVLRPENEIITSVREQLHRLYEQSMEISDDQAREVMACVEDISGNYGENLRVVMGEEHITSKHVGIAASVVTSYQRQIEKNEKKKIQEEIKKSLVQGYLAEPKEKITDVPVTITKVIGGFEDGFGGVKSMLLAITDSGYLLKWFGAVPEYVGDHPVVPGNKFDIARATVKENSLYNGDYQTVINRVKFVANENTFTDEEGDDNEK